MLFNYLSLPIFVRLIALCQNVICRCLVVFGVENILLKTPYFIPCLLTVSLVYFS